jgi:dTDP-4-amino-4,6-dideoxygalactose transaminase
MSLDTVIPLVNLRRQYVALKDDIAAAIDAVLDSQHFIKGPAVRAFETAWLSALGASHGSGCSNGTSALSLALQGLGIGAGDEVITTAHTFIATAEAICHVGATPVFVDIDPASYTVDPAAVAAAVTPRTRAIMPVHLYGAAADMDALLGVADRHSLAVVEDAAQAHLGRWHGRALGTLGDAGTFSFYPGKNLGAYGDAGFVVARDRRVAETIERLIDHGRQRGSKYLHDVVGQNQRMDDLQAAVLSVKLRHLDAWTATRRAHAARYDARLKPAGFKVIEPLAGSEPVYHLYVVEVADRDAVMEALRARGVGCGVHYPVPLHLQPAFAGSAARGALPKAERAADHVLSLPICGSITEDEVDRVCDAVLAVARPLDRE